MNFSLDQRQQIMHDSITAVGWRWQNPHRKRKNKATVSGLSAEWMLTSLARIIFYKRGYLREHASELDFFYSNLCSIGWPWSYHSKAHYKGYDPRPLTITDKISINHCPKTITQQYNNAKSYFHWLQRDYRCALGPVEIKDDPPFHWVIRLSKKVGLGVKVELLLWSAVMEVDEIMQCCLKHVFANFLVHILTDVLWIEATTAAQDAYSELSIFKTA